MRIIYDKIVIMRYCRRCRGKYDAQVQITAKNYGEDTYIQYKTISCSCFKSRPTHQMQILSIA